MNPPQPNEVIRSQKVVALRIFGAVMIIVGAMDMMLLWRNGEVPSWFYVAIFLIGILIQFIAAVVQKTENRPSDAEAETKNKPTTTANC